MTLWGPHASPRAHHSMAFGEREVGDAIVDAPGVSVAGRREDLLRESKFWVIMEGRSPRRSRSTDVDALTLHGERELERAAVTDLEQHTAELTDRKPEVVGGVHVKADRRGQPAGDEACHPDDARVSRKLEPHDARTIGHPRAVFGRGAGFAVNISHSSYVVPVDRSRANARRRAQDFGVCW